MARTVVLIFVASLGLQFAAFPALAAPSQYDVPGVSGMAISGGGDALPAAQRQVTDTGVDDPAGSGAAPDSGRLAALTVIVHQLDARSAGNLAKVSAIEVPNLSSRPEFVVDAREQRFAAERAAADFAAAEATRSAAAVAEAQAQVDAAVAAALAVDQVNDDAEVAALKAKHEAESAAAVAAALATDQADDDAEVAALTATHVAAAQDQVDAAVTAALAADQKADDAQAAVIAATREAETASAEATATAEARAAASALRAAEEATSRAEGQAAAAMESHRQFVQRLTMVAMTLSLLTAGLLCLKVWRNRKEPFVLKAVPVSETAHVHA